MAYRFKIDPDNLPEGYSLIPADVINRAQKSISEKMEGFVKEANRRKAESLRKFNLSNGRQTRTI